MNEFSEMAVTGIGVVAPTGTTKHAFFEAVSNGAHSQDGACNAEAPPPGQLLNHLKISNLKLKIARYMDPVSKNAIVAVGEAMSDACIEESVVAQAPHKYGIVFGAARGSHQTRKGLYESLASRQGKMVSGTLFSHCGYNIAGAMTAIAHGMKGPNLTVAGRGDLGLCILRRARQILMTERAHTVFAGFTECDVDAKPRSIPFRECAYALCLERKDRAVSRQAAILTEISLQDEEKGVAAAGRDAVRGWHRRESALAENAEALSSDLPGMPAVGGRYDSLIKIGLLSHNAELKERFPAVAFSAGEDRSRARIKLLYAREESFAT